MNKWQNTVLKVPSHCKEPVPIVCDAAMATEGVGDGRFVPVLIVDASKRSDIEELVKFHDHIPSGDVKCSWGSNSVLRMERKPRDLTRVALFLEFERPWNLYNFNQFLEWENNGVPADKQESYERNRNLFYVACSRPKKRLCLLFTQQLSASALQALENWFGQENILAV